MSESPAASAAAVPQSPLTALGLYDIDWSQLDHAYGPAEDTPGHLETLYRVSRRTTDDTDADDDKDGIGALYELDGSLAHQGSRYSATQAAVPFVYAVLGDGSVSGESSGNVYRHYRAEILAFLGRLAVGNPEAFVPRGIDTAAWRAATAAKQAASWPAEEEKRRADWVAEAEAAGDEAEIRRRRLEDMMKCDPVDEAATAAVEIGCYDAVRKGLSAVLPFLQPSRDNDNYSNANTPAVRSEAALLLAMFPESPQAEASEQALRALLERETVATVRGSALMALALLWKRRIATSGDDGDNDDNDDAAASVQTLLQELHASAKARFRQDSGDTDAVFEQWCSAAALVTLLGTEGVSTAVLVDVVAPLQDDRGVYAKYQPGKLRRKRKRDEADEQDERSEDKKDSEEKGERSEDPEEGERSEDAKDSERSEDKKERFTFAPTDLDGLCATLLGDVKGSAHPDVAYAMMGALGQAEGFSVLDLAHTVLSVAFDGTAPGTSATTSSSSTTTRKDKLQPPFAQLSALQQDAVRAMTGVSDFCWKYANYKTTLKHWGLPSEREALTAYVEGREAGEAKAE
ncbi:hypothetical protein SCUCBS95973_001446 [Sporothrix curviconia]|uniref:Uncharacterized protein n=1 Tax=Sporothrix curviconia TaxID=1260050 RepID=A0ABP0AYN2_9PEZI